MMEITEGGGEGEEDGDEVGNDEAVDVARWVGGGGGLDPLELRARSPAAQSSKVALIGPFLTRVKSVYGDHFVGMSCPMFGRISTIILGCA